MKKGDGSLSFLNVQNKNLSSHFPLMIFVSVPIASELQIALGACSVVSSSCSGEDCLLETLV